VFSLVLLLSPIANPPIWRIPLQDGVHEFMGQVVVLHMIVIGVPIILGIRRGRGDPDIIYDGLITSQVAATMMIALGATPLALIEAATLAQMQTPPQAHRGNGDSFGTFVFLLVSGYLLLLVGLALTWRGWAESLTLTVRRRKWLGAVLLCIAVLPLIAAIAYTDYVLEVFGFVFPFGDAAQITRDASIRSIPTSLALDPWIVGVLVLLTPLAVIAYDAWWLRRMDTAVRAPARSGAPNDHRVLP